MDIDVDAAHWRRLKLTLSRRGLVALTGGVLAALPLGLTAAKPKHGKHRQHKRKRHHKQKQQGVTPVPPPPPEPVVRVDATCAATGESEIFDVDGNRRLAQTFTAVASGLLVSAEVPTSKEPGSNGDYIFRLSAVDGTGAPTNDVLAESTVANAGVPDGDSTLTFTFVNPAAVRADTAYALVLTRPGDSEVAWRGQSDNPCAGQVFVSVDQTAPFVSAGEDLVDLFFTTFVSA